MATYTNEAQQRIIKLVEVLAGHEDKGLSLKDIAVLLGTSTTASFRDLKNLEAVGWAMQLKNTNWAMTAKAAQPLKAVANNVHKLMGEVNRINKEYLQGELN